MGLLSLAAAALACAKPTVRGMEDFSVDLGKRGRVALGLEGPVSDSTLYRLLAEQQAQGLRQTVTAWVQQEWTAKRLKNDLLPLGLLSVDGKGSWSSDEKVEGAKESHCADGTPFWMMGSLRAVLTSSSAHPCLDQELLAAKSGEATAFRVLFPRVCEAHGGKFKVVSGDAGLTARENAQTVQSHEKWYSFGLKENQPTLFHAVRLHFCHSPGPVLAETRERAHGETVVRRLYSWVLDGTEGLDFPDLKQAWCVRQTRHRDDGGFSMEEHYYLVSIPAGVLTHEQELFLVRRHWGSENGHNWTMDMVLLEDDRKPCQQSASSIEVVLWLRLIGYNILSAWRSSLPLKDNLPIAWGRAAELLRDALVLLGTLAAPGALAPNV